MFSRCLIETAPESIIAELEQKRVKNSCGVFELPNGRKFYYKRVSVENDHVLNEIAILQRLSSDYVQALKWTWLNGNRLYMFFDWVDLNLQEVLDQQARMSIEESRRIFTELLRALVYLEESDIVHRNIKPASLLISSTGLIKLSNFSVAVKLYGSRYILAPAAGCYLTIPPEADEEIVSPAWDMWSSAVVLSVMLTGQYPFQPGESSYPMREAVCALFGQIKDRAFRLDNIGLQSGHASILLERIFNSNWEDRPCARDLLRFGFVDPLTVGSPIISFVLKKIIPYRLNGRNKIIRAPVCFACVVQRVKDVLKTNTGTSTEKETSIVSVPSPDSTCEKHHQKAPLWVVHWADFTHQFGFCVAFSNGCSSILYNDMSTVYSDIDGTTHYFENDGIGLRFSLRRAPPALKNKIAYLQWWRKETCGKASNTSAQTSGLRNWWRTEAGMALTFDGVLQFDFIDGTRLVLSPFHILKFPKNGGCELNRWTLPLMPQILFDQIAHLDLVVDKINENYPGSFQ